MTVAGVRALRDKTEQLVVGSLKDVQLHLP
jgi:hypothetical protein